jgi:2-(1,2-epoxy-1,2-dihydrophenyl)acetyl-CoA isomerase
MNARAVSVREDACLLSERQGRVLVLTLNRPEKLNALSPELHDALLAAVQAAASDPDVGAVVLTGAGRAFCAGGDLAGSRPAEDAPRSTVESRADGLIHHAETARLLHAMPKPTIAMINGPAAGAGLALALACDLRIAGCGATLTTAYVKVGLSGDFGVSYFLTRLVGPAGARELMFLSDRINAEEALRIGLVNRLEDDATLGETTLQLARRLAEGPGVALRYMKQNLLAAEGDTLDAVLEREAYSMARCGRTEDAREASAAFREKRAPRFQNR